MKTDERPMPDRAALVDELIRCAGRRDVLHAQHMGNAMPDDAYAEFTKLRDVRIPELRAQLTAAPQAPALDAVKWNALTETALDSFLEDYEMCGEAEDGRDAVHTPTEGERALIKDAVMGFLAEAEDAAMSAQGGGK